MVRAAKIFDALQQKGVSFFTGVPDSLLKDFCAYVTDHTRPASHIIAANEGSAIAIAAGHHLATGTVAAVYLQNSGLGNAVNPLLSLAHPKVYAVPLVLIIGWRGEPGKHDEPQHLAQGPLTVPLLKTLGIVHAVLPTDERKALAMVKQLVTRAQKNNRPVALVVREGTFEAYKPQKKSGGDYPLTREAALHLMTAYVPDNAVIVSTTGKLSRELFEHRKSEKTGHHRDFLTVGSMGHASQIALGIALAQPKRPVYCFDGDGAAIMHLGGWTVIGQAQPKNLKHIVFNNGVHESVGGQATAGFVADFTQIAKASGYRDAVCATDARTVKAGMAKLKRAVGPALLEVRIGGGSRKDLGRPTRTPLQNKKDLMKFLKKR